MAASPLSRPRHSRERGNPWPTVRRYSVALQGCTRVSDEIPLLFVVLAVLLIPYGLFVESATTPLSSNIDLWWGLVMLVFGALLLALARASEARHARIASHVQTPTEES